MDASKLLTPEAIIVLPLAITIDAIGIILVCFLLDDFGITDIIGWSTLGVWSFFRSQIKGSAPIDVPGKKASKAAKTGKWLRLLEFAPYLGAFPFWTISTYLILKEE